MNLNFNTGVPAANNNPSTDQSPMQVNNVSNAAIWNVDHFGFSDNFGGWHKNIRLPQITGNTDPAAVTVPANAGQLYTKTIAGDLELFYESPLGTVSQLTNDGSILPRASVIFTVIAGIVTIISSFNVSTVTRSSAGIYNINFSPVFPTSLYFPCILGFGGVVGSVFAPQAVNTLSLLFQNVTTGLSADSTVVTVVIFQ